MTAVTADANLLSWYEASARQRIDALVDAGSFTELIGPVLREMSPHLAIFDLPEQFDDGIVVGRGRLDGTPVLVAAQEGRFMAVPSARSMAPSSRASCAPRVRFIRTY